MTGLIADTRAAIAAAMQRATVRIVVLILVEFFFELTITKTGLAGFSDLANCLSIVALRLVAPAHPRLWLRGFEDLNHLGSLRVNLRAMR